jgi:hypothetical protein
MKWCCTAFENHYTMAGERGIAVVVDRFAEGYAFFLQHRALEPDDPGPLSHPRPISTVSQVHIHFCPWCGRSLAKFYADRVQEMIRPGLTIPEP